MSDNIDHIARCVLLWLELPADHSLTAQEFARLLAGKIEDNQVQMKWRLPSHDTAN